MADNGVPTWVAAAGVVLTAAGTWLSTAAKFKRTPAEEDAKRAKDDELEQSMLNATLRENGELRSDARAHRAEIEKIWAQLSECEKHHRECLKLQHEAADRAANLERELAALAGKVADIQEQQRAA